MPRCLQCNASMAKDEEVCPFCAAPAKVRKSVKAVWAERISLALTIAFFASAGMTVASLFVDFTPSFIKCITTTLVLLLIRSSAQQMDEKSQS